MKKSLFLIFITLGLMGVLYSQINVTNPTAGQSLCKGATLNITWTSSDCPTENVKIRLRQGAIKILDIHDSTLDDGTFNWPVTASLASGSYFIRVASTDGVMIGDSPNFNIVLCPDLIVESITHTYDNPPPRSCDTATVVTVEAKVKNIGAVRCPHDSMGYIIITGPEPFSKKTCLFPIHKLGVGKSETSKCRYRPYTMGFYRHEVTVDINSRVTEKNESNNKKHKLLGVAPLPDLVVCMENNIKNKATIKKKLWVSVVNKGQMFSTPCKLRWYIEKNKVKWRDVPRLKPGENIVFYRHAKWWTKGTKKMSAIVDYYNTVRESKEHNNKVEGSGSVTISRKYTITSTYKKCSDGTRSDH